MAGTWTTPEMRHQRDGGEIAFSCKCKLVEPNPGESNQPLISRPNTLCLRGSLFHRIRSGLDKGVHIELRGDAPTIKGRGAAHNPPNRFEKIHVEPDEDWN